MRAVPGVIGVHDLHVWTVTSGMVTLTGHVVADGGCILPNELLRPLRTVLADRFAIEHVTLQIEAPSLEAEEVHPQTEHPRF
jgi:cobalt-zinc-cadmium efflux system protein